MKKSLCIFLVTVFCVTMCIGAFSLSALAVLPSNQLVPYFPESQTPSASDSCYFAYDTSYSTGEYATTRYQNENVVVVASGSYIYFVSDVHHSASDNNIRIRSGGGSQSWKATSISYSADGHSVYYAEISLPSSWDFNFSKQSTMADAMSYAIGIIYGSPEPVIDHTVSMYIQPGTMVRIKSPGNLTWNLETTFDYTSSKVNNNYLWIYNSSYYFVSQNAVSIGFNTGNFVNDGYNNHLVPWLRMDPLNLWGNSKNAKFASVTSLNGSYLYIYIPVNDYNEVDAWFFSGLFHKDSQNHPVLLECDNASEIVVYTMGESVESGFIYGTTQTFYTYTEYGMFEDENGTVVSSVQGDIELDPQTSTLDTLVTTIQSFFVGTWEHISSLTRALGSFPSFFSSLFSFLPGDVTSIIVSLFGILCTLGVVKALL